MAIAFVLVLVLLLLLPIGVLALVGGLGLSRYLSARRFVADAAHAEAIVVRLPARLRDAPTGNGTFIQPREFRPVVRFETAQGQQVEARVEFGTPKPSVTLGQATPVLYDPQRPQRVRLGAADGRKQAIRTLVAGCIGALVLFLVLLGIALALNLLVRG
jgi:hypothetical protein